MPRVRLADHHGDHQDRRLGLLRHRPLMAATKTRAGARRRPDAAPAARPPARRITVARFKEATKLIERLVEEKQDVFLAAGQRFRARHREQTSRPLTHEEAAQVAAALLGADGDRLAMAERAQASELRAY